MLRIIQNRSAAGAASYYGHAEYYGEGKEKAGLWGGKTAAALGLSGVIEERDFKALCENRDPRTGDRLTARQGDNRTVGYDFNFHVPKGVSLAYAVGGDDRIAGVFDRAVGETMAEIEAEAATRVRVGGKHEDRVTGNLAWGQFLHTTTRPDEKGVPDPHLHAHCFVFNVTRDPKEGRYKAAQFRELKRDAGYFEARFHARLAKAMREELGYGIRREGRHWDVAGLTPTVKEKFSRRTAEIEALAQEKGITDAAEKAELGAVTRKTKANRLSFGELRAEWRSRLTDDERDGLGQLTEPREPPRPATTLEAAVRQALDHSFERESVVPERHVLGEALRIGAGTVDVHAVAGEAARQGLRTRTLEGRRLSTTPAVLADERAVLDFAKSGRNAVSPLNANWRPDARSILSDEQTNAVRHLATGRDRLQLLLGGAGTGKTTLMTAAVAAIEAGGREVFTFAPSAEASRKVLRDEGFSNATTVAELLVNQELQQKTAGQVIWIDEASLLGTRQLRRVTDLAARNGTRLILSGDWRRQHDSVTRGGVLGLLDRYAGVTPVEIGTIRRQSGEYKQAVAAMAEGDVAGGFDRLDDLGWVRELPDDVERNGRIAKDYADLRAKKRSVLVVSPTHAEARGLTAAIRSELKSRDLIRGDERAVATLIPRHLTEAERADPAFLRAGDVVVFQQNARGHRKGQRLVIEADGVAPESLVEQAARYSVFRPGSLPLAAGDCVRLTAGGRTADGSHRLNNGGVYELAGFTPGGDLLLSNGWTLPADYGHLAHGFVSTSHASQGRTVDHVLIAESSASFAAAGREQFYVSASRGRKSATVYTDDKDALREAVGRGTAGRAASGLFGRAGEGRKAPSSEKRHRERTMSDNDQELRLVVDRERRHRRQLEETTPSPVASPVTQKRKEVAYGR